MNVGLRDRTTDSTSRGRVRRVSNEMNRQTSTMGGESRAKVGRLTSLITFSRRSSGATMNNGMLRFGCIASRSDILNSPEQIDVVLSISKAASMLRPFSQSTWSVTGPTGPWRSSVRISSSTRAATTSIRRDLGPRSRSSASCLMDASFVWQLLGSLTWSRSAPPSFPVLHRVCGARLAIGIRFTMNQVRPRRSAVVSVLPGPLGPQPQGGRRCACC